MSASPPTLRRAAPLLGADDADILGELGYSAGEIAALRARKVIA
jgi:crotonobetainyl-CoA:carnitine CoA-transferase CaiB-like acyl-CoA transferase